MSCAGRKRSGLLVLAFVLCFVDGALYAQASQPPAPEAGGGNAADPPPPAPPLTPEQKRIDMDIKTSSLTELAAWCRSVGLSEGGTREELARRLRDYFKITEAPAQGEDKRKIITIESARSTEYFKIEVVDEEYARLSGEVKVSLKDGDAVHRIRAWDILFNRTRNILTASGGVEYIKEEGDKIETFRGDSITVNLDNWSSIFLGGISERSLQSDSTTYLFAGDVISRNDEDVTVLSKASISNANNPESLWSLNASRVWLLPGSDFAIFNAVLKVGEIPVMYIPFFYYPADEVIFHPVIGFRTREGNFVQTSTYILGRPRANSTSQSSLTKILGNSSDMEKKREGLFLRSTGKKAVDPGAVTLKAIVDYYANLGGYFGTDLTMPKAGILGTTDISLGIGVSRTIVNLGSSSYSPFAPNYDGTSDWNSSNLFSMDVPFRYRFKMSSSLSGKYGSLSWNIPYYSDPYMDRDFLNRAEEMDWVNMIQKGAAVEAEETSENLVSSYNWQLSGSVNPRFPNMSPYISGISISGISSNISFKTKTLPTTHPNYNKDSPMRLFYYPDTYTIYSVSGSISGTPLTLGASKPAPSNTAKPAEPAKPEDDPLKGIGVPRPPWESAAEKTAKKDDAADKLVPPVLSQRFDIRRVGNVQFSMNYRLSPTGASELQFRSSKWQEYSDIDWGEVRSVLSTVGGDASTGLSLNHSDGLFTNSFTYSGNGSWRQYSYLNEEAEDYLTNGNPDPDKVSAARKQQYGQSAFSTSYSLSSSLKPLYRSTVWGSSGIQYSLSGLAVKSVFDQTSTGEDPKWDLEYADWTKEKITTHQFSANIAASIMEKTQNLTLSADLPPKDSALSWNAAFRVWISETSANMRILFPGEADKRKLEPFYTTETLKFGSFGTLTHYMVLDTELKELTTVTSSLSLSKWGLSASYAAVRMLGYEFISGTGTGTGWVQKTGDQTLQSRDFSLTYAKTFSQKDLWNKRLNFSVNLNSRLFFDLQRYTSSSFSFSLGFTLGINKFVDLSLSATSENAAIYWYLKDLPMFADLPPELHDGEYNLFTDLINSFRFDNDDLRRSSAFKMKTFRLTATHHMGDWNAVLGITMSPYRPTNSLKYEINNEISFLIQWLPISEIKSDMSYSKRTDIWTVK